MNSFEIRNRARQEIKLEKAKQKRRLKKERLWKESQNKKLRKVSCAKKTKVAVCDENLDLSVHEEKPKKMTYLRKSLYVFAALSFFLNIMTWKASAQGTLGTMVETLFGESAQTVDIIILLTVLTLLPSIVIMLTGFTRIIIVLSFVRNALGMQQTPPNQVLIGLALFLTLFVMGPVFSQIYNEAYIPYVNEEITQDEFYTDAMDPLREFMMSQTYESDMNFFVNLTEGDYSDVSEVPNRVVIPAFLISEIKRAFQIGFFIYIPFIVIDMVVASTLMAMGMMMLPPAMISLPFKVLIFVMVDGWQLIVGTIVNSFS